MAGICSFHRGFDPNCDLCKTDPRHIFPDWDAKLAAAQAAGQVKCACGFDFFRTTHECPKCGRAADTTMILAVQAIHPALTNELIAFVDEWLKRLGFVGARMRAQQNGSFVIRAFETSPKVEPKIVAETEKSVD